MGGCIGMDRRFYYFKENSEKYMHAGYKARVDILTLCEKLGGYPIDFFKKPIKNKFLKLMNLIVLLRIVKHLKPGDILFLQSQTALLGKIIKKLKKKRVRTIMLIHDIDGLRSSNMVLLKKELELFKNCDVLIVHNEEMAKKLELLGLDRSCMISLGAFDYICEKPKDFFSRKGICFAGNLTKSGFLSELPDSIIEYGIKLYGPNSEGKKIDSRINYEGAFLPEEIPNKISDSKYALIWDGDSLNTCSGLIGQYMLYNNPHKLSLYLAAEVPVIVWEEAAVASFVKENKVGICVKSLEDVTKKINEVSQEQYSEFIKNVKEIGEKIRRGYFFERAINYALKKIIPKNENIK